MKSSTFASFGIAALIAIGASASITAQAPPVSRGRMTLSMSNGACVKTLAGNAGGDTIRASRGATVQWDVTNNCSGNVTVAVGDFERKGGGGDDPFVAGRTSCAAAPGRTCAIALRVRGDAGVRTYSYSVSINGTKQDPDLIIEG